MFDAQNARGNGKQWFAVVVEDDVELFGRCPGRHFYLARSNRLTPSTLARGTHWLYRAKNVLTVQIKPRELISSSVPGVLASFLRVSMNPMHFTQPMRKAPGECVSKNGPHCAVCKFAVLSSRASNLQCEDITCKTVPWVYPGLGAMMMDSP